VPTSGSSPPKKINIGDFSQESTAKAVRKDILQHPLTVYSLPLIIGGGLATFLINPIFAVLLCSGIAIGGGSWIINNYFRRDVFESRYVKQLREVLLKQRENMLESLESELKECHSIEGVEQYADQGAEQFKMVKERFDNLQDILSEKLNQGELTFIRYAGTAEQVYLSVLDNLRTVVSLFKSISTIDENYIQMRLRELGKMKKLTKADEQEIATLNERKQLRDTQLEKINVFLTQNEEAMTEMNKAAVAIAEMKTDKSTVSVDIETARKELEELAKRANLYSTIG